MSRLTIGATLKENFLFMLSARLIEPKLVLSDVWCINHLGNRLCSCV